MVCKDNVQILFIYKCLERDVRFLYKILKYLYFSHIFTIANIFNIQINV